MAIKKNLLIIRHGKSDWFYDDDLVDIDRPLKPKGVSDAYKMANLLKKKKISPSAIYSSPANRALHTAIIFSRVLSFPLNKLKIHETIYMAHLNDMLRIIKETGDDIHSMIIFGHNPTSTNLANFFLEKQIEHIPTTGIVSLSFACASWKNISKDNALLLFFEHPKADEN